MNWEQRWREMLLAGGAVAVAGCGDHASKGAAGDADTDGSGYVCCTNGGADPCIGSVDFSACQQAETACESDGGSFNVAAESCEFANVPCCNANPDPCCTCDGTPMNAAECVAEMACQADGGVYDSLLLITATGSSPPGCRFPGDAGSTDAAPGDAGPADTGTAGD